MIGLGQAGVPRPARRSRPSRVHAGGQAHDRPDRRQPQGVGEEVAGGGAAGGPIGRGRPGPRGRRRGWSGDARRHRRVLRGEGADLVGQVDACRHRPRPAGRARRGRRRCGPGAPGRAGPRRAAGRTRRRGQGWSWPGRGWWPPRPAACATRARPPAGAGGRARVLLEGLQVVALGRPRPSAVRVLVRLVLARLQRPLTTHDKGGQRDQAGGQGHERPAQRGPAARRRPRAGRRHRRFGSRRR